MIFPHVTVSRIKVRPVLAQASRLTRRLPWRQLGVLCGAGVTIFALDGSPAPTSLIHSLNAGCEFQVID
ncbi:hypothetical protein MPL3356_90196 [Mesorhizobium plurifarium]|uniref:Uncharacterized protein n=1 Tax=Mesorhizobium plurifarium TaxID=69974 RepID=A0A090GDS6_MESPL|nr:hypothetical protein MPL3356_90196 [Mesorhizobium plurifarium]